ncbi:MAG: plasmid pRiA4b ORF-3 family protein [Planctomycetaceae bacterium]|jgi:hypothetical protein
MSSPEASASQPGISFQWTAAERQHLLPLLRHLDSGLGRRLAEIPPQQEIALTKQEFRDFCAFLSAEVVLQSDPTTSQALLALLDRVQGVVDGETPDPSRTLRGTPSRDGLREAEGIDELFLELVKMVSEDPELGQQKFGDLVIPDNDLPFVEQVPGLSPALRAKLRKKKRIFTLGEVVNLILAIRSALEQPEFAKLERLDAMSEFLDFQIQPLLMDLMSELEREAKREARARLPKPRPTRQLYQFKITLLNTDPVVWRRILVKDGTLDDLHRHIQRAMGWEELHPHEFVIRKKHYANPDILEEDFDEDKCEDSTQTLISAVLPPTNRRFSFQYEYDFGDCWLHEIEFEGRRAIDPDVKYPKCIDGERACPPEDCGGPHGYQALLDDYEEVTADLAGIDLEELGGDFDPFLFSPPAATKAMQKRHRRSS